MKKNKVLNVLIQFKNLYLKLGDKYRATAYANAIESYRLSGHDNLTEHMKKKVQHIEKYGTHPDLTKLKKYQKLIGVLGFGPAIIRKMINKGIPPSGVKEMKLTDLQKIGLKYHNRILENFARSKVQKIVDTIKFNDKYWIVGSYRRGKNKINDIDILTLSEPDIPEKSVIIAKGKKKITFLCPYKKNYVHIDIRIIEEKDLAPALLYFTGSGDFNVLMRRIAKKRGLLLNEYGLFAKEKLPIDSEEDIFKKVGIEYLKPEFRYPQNIKLEK